MSFKGRPFFRKKFINSVFNTDKNIIAQIEEISKYIFIVNFINEGVC